MICCGKEEPGNFCSSCGKELRTYGQLPKLYSYLSTHKRQAEDRLVSAKKVLAENKKAKDQEMISRYEYIVDHVQKNLDKWKGWADAVYEAM